VSSLASTFHRLLLNWTRSQSYLTTDGKSASLSWYQATTWELRPTFLSHHWRLSLDIYVLVTSGWVCNLGLLLGLTSAVCLRFESRGTHAHTLLSQFWHAPPTWRAIIASARAAYKTIIKSSSIVACILDAIRAWHGRQIKHEVICCGAVPYQWEFLGLHKSCFEQMYHGMKFWFHLLGTTVKQKKTTAFTSLNAKQAGTTPVQAGRVH
jgi:hypothetical protein